MERIVILGGGVGGTLTANLLVKRLGVELDDGRAAITVIDATGQHTYQPGFMYIAMGGERASRPAPPGDIPPRSPGPARGRRGRDGRSGPQTITLDWGETVPYDQLVIATGCRIVPEAIDHFDTEAHHFYTAEAAASSCATRSTRSPADGSSSASPACPTSARRRRWRWPS